MMKGAVVSTCPTVSLPCAPCRSSPRWNGREAEAAALGGLQTDSMFKRRIPLPFHRRARSFLWPRGGWRRSGTYVAHRLRRLPGPPYRIAAGFASGAAISFTPFIGLHFVLATLLALCLKIGREHV